MGPGEPWELQAECLQEPGSQSPQTPLPSPWATPDLSHRGGPGFSHHLSRLRTASHLPGKRSSPGRASRRGSWGPTWDSDSDRQDEVSVLGGLEHRTVEDAEKRGGESCRRRDKVTNETRRDTVHTWAQLCSSLPQDSNVVQAQCPCESWPKAGRPRIYQNPWMAGPCAFFHNIQ